MIAPAYCFEKYFIQSVGQRQRSQLQPVRFPEFKSLEEPGRLEFARQSIRERGLHRERNPDNSGRTPKYPDNTDNS